MSDIEIILGLRERLLPGFDPDRIARDLTPALDRSDRAAATAIWRSIHERAGRCLTRQRVPKATREAVLRDLSAAVTLALFAHRGSNRLGPVPKSERPRKPSNVVRFAPRAAGGER